MSILGPLHITYCSDYFLSIAVCLRKFFYKKDEFSLPVIEFAIMRSFLVMQNTHMYELFKKFDSPVK